MSKSRMTPAGELFRDHIHTLQMGTEVSAVRLRSWFERHEIGPDSRPGLFRHACNKHWLIPTGTVDRHSQQSTRRGAWALVYRVTGNRET